MSKDGVRVPARSFEGWLRVGQGGSQKAHMPLTGYLRTKSFLILEKRHSDPKYREKRETPLSNTPNVPSFIVTTLEF